MAPERQSAVIHMLETAVVTWMKQVKMTLDCNPSGAILKKCGKYAGPLEEIEVHVCVDMYIHVHVRRV